MQHAAQPQEEQASEDTVLKSALVTTVAALMLVSTLFITAFSSVEAAASPAQGAGNDGHMVSVGYLA